MSIPDACTTAENRLLLGRVSAFRKQQVDLSTQFEDEMFRPDLLILGSRLGHLAHGNRHLTKSDAKREIVLVGATHHVVPRRRLLWLIRKLGSTLFGQRELTTAVFGLGLNQTLILQKLKGRVERPRARSPNSLSSVRKFLHHLVAVHRTFGEQRENRKPDVPPSTATAASRRFVVMTLVMTEVLIATFVATAGSRPDDVSSA